MIAIVNGTLHTVSHGMVKDGTVLIDDEGRIAAVGTGVTVPAGAESVDASGLNVFPGFVDAHTHLGIWEEGVGRVFWDGNEATDPVTPHVRALDALNPRDQGLADARSVGVRRRYV
jgi:imidazolonepropionase-like amidohydrolase